MCCSCGDQLDTKEFGRVPDLFCVAEPLAVRGFVLVNGATLWFSVQL